MPAEQFEQAERLLSHLTPEEQRRLFKRVGLPDYPWYDAAEGDDIQQGDILERCRVFKPPPDLEAKLLSGPEVVWEERDLVVLSQSCDLVKGRCKVEEVLFCAVWARSEFKPEDYLSTSKGMENARRGNLPAFHVLAESEIVGLEREIQVVDFRRVCTLPIEYVRNLASEKSPRLRVLPPYREQLAQAFARFFMRVGLPIDIPTFTKSVL